MTLKEKLQILEKEWTNLAIKIKAKLSEKDQTIQKIQQEKTEVANKLETTLKENTANEQILEKLLQEFQELSKNL